MLKSDIFLKRVQRLRTLIHANKAEALLVSSEANVRYLSGFTLGECRLLITAKNAFFIGDSRYFLQAEKDIPKFYKNILIQDPLAVLLRKLFREEKLRVLGFESAHTTYSQYTALKSRLTPYCRLLALPDLVMELRLLKSEDEIKSIRKALLITKRALGQIERMIRPGVTEIFLKNKLEQRLKELGAQGTAFETIVASGPHAAMPHASSGERRIRRNEPVIVDVGCIWQGYKSDLTRTFFSGKITPFLEIQKLVANAQDRAIKLIRPGVKACKLDQAARNVLKEANLDQYFGHALGHGVGLEVHEAPQISAKNEQILKAGMIFTVEPGVYIAGSGGIRIEDMVMVTKNGYEVL